MNILVYLISLPIAVATLAALLATRDGVNGSWALLRALLYVAALLLLVWLAGGTSIHWVGYAFGTVISGHILAFYLGRWFFIGLK